MALGVIVLKRYVSVGVVLLILVGLMWTIYSRGILGPPQIGIAMVKQGDLQQGIFGVGTVEALRAYTIGPTQAGRVLSVLVDQGQAVKAGQVLGRIDPVDLEQRINGADMARQRSQIAMQVAEVKVREAASRNDFALVNAKRYSQLLANQAISKEVAEAKINEATIAQAILEEAQLGLQGTRRDMEKAEAEHVALRKQLENLTLIAPADGIIVSREAEPGSTVVAGQAVLRMVDPGSLWVRARIDQTRSGKIMVGQTAKMVLRSRQEEIISGKVARIEALGDSVAEEKVVGIAFNEIPVNLSLGELAEVTIELPPVKGALIVPSAAVKRANNQYGVWRVVDGKTRFYPVKIGVQSLDGNTQVIDGLSLGDPVIAYSPVDLKEGMKVRAGGEL